MLKFILSIVGAIVLMSCSFSAWALDDRVFLLQDENFFLQDEIKKMQRDLVDRDESLKRLLLEKEALRYAQDAATREKEALESKVDRLQKAILKRDDEFPAKVEEAAIPYRSQMRTALKEVEALKAALEAETARVALVVKDKAALQARIDMLTGEKMSLRGSLKIVADELDQSKAERASCAADQKAACDARQKDLEARLKAEQVLTLEKLKALELQLADKDKEAAQKLKAQVVPLQEKIAKLEEQITLVRQAAGAEVKKAQEACRNAALNK